MLVLFALVSRSLAADPTVSGCVAGQAPAAYASYGCHSACSTSEGGAPEYWAATCSVASGEPVAPICSGEFQTKGAEAYAVHNYSGGEAYTFSVWGEYTSGNKFCCFIDDRSGQKIIEFTLEGASTSDLLSFATGGRTMENPGTGQFVAKIRGDGCDDEITGSTDPFTSWVGYGIDFIWGDEGDDTITGGAGNDVVRGGAGADDLYGEADDDLLMGGRGDDFLSGGSGDNVMCGGRGEVGGAGDWFTGTIGSNQSWEPFVAGDPTPGGSFGLGSSATCGHTLWGTGWAGSWCSYVLSTKPSGCGE